MNQFARWFDDKQLKEKIKRISVIPFHTTTRHEDTGLNETTQWTRKISIRIIIFQFICVVIILTNKVEINGRTRKKKKILTRKKKLLTNASLDSISILIWKLGKWLNYVILILVPFILSLTILSASKKWRGK